MSELTEHDYVGPHGLRVRGTVLLIPGRGETAHSYVRFGARLAADAYRVRVLAAPVVDTDDVDGSLDRLAQQVSDAIADLESSGPIARPLVLIGADTGAVALGALAARVQYSPDLMESAWWPQAVVLAGLPGYSTQPAKAGSWEEELDARTACPVHRAVLTDDVAVQRGTLADAVPVELLDAVYGSTVDLPHLLLVGDSDSYADHDALVRAAKALPQARLTQVRGGHHDVLNDLQHRSVAAEVVTFLEALRDESVLVPIVSVKSSAW
jgi:alpha-beta hydrolase superfamily lysophospholipase